MPQVPPKEKERAKQEKRSKAWMFFEPLEGQRARCKLCKEYRTFSANGTSTMLNHLQRAHEGEAVFSIPFDKEHAHHYVLVDIVQNYVPLTRVKDKYYRRKFKFYSQPYAPPSYGKLTKKLLPELRQKTVAAMKTKLADIESLSASMDEWSSDSKQLFLGITARGYDSSGKNQKFLLDVRSLHKSRKDAATLVKTFKKVVTQDYQIPLEKIVCLTTDGGANVKRAVRDLNKPWIHCSSHVLNLVVQHVLVVPDKKKKKKQNGAEGESAGPVEPPPKHPEIVALLKRARAIAKYFRGSSKATAALKSEQRRLEQKPKLKLTLDCPTRWGSTYKMIERILTNKAAIFCALDKLTGIKKKKPRGLSDDDFDLLARLRDVLKEMDLATHDMSADHPTVGEALHTFKDLICNHLAVSDQQDDIISKAKRQMRDELTGHWNELAKQVQSSKALLLAIRLDPLYKNFAECASSHGAKILMDKANGIIISEGANNNSVNQTVPPDDCDEVAHPKTKRQRTHLENSVPTVTDIQLELAHYDSIRKSKKEPVLWWKKQQSVLPFLYQLFLKYSCVTTASVSCERTFSKSGWLVNKRRTSLRNETISNIMISKENYHHFLEANPSFAD